ncbi:hypothetical protein PFICI_07214 [Pestalotiopsis fici W106-1]|uniref:Uncharacterized protein n=1 Tax=Pestalotiopsis fici (strain W106-1 / CGMCC3.15140) TaxID=1229662 RepID=W3X9Y4_PESFW|nr:uncharacterized protein PFICI_07214 [Pestalotiopsis fici W106-1]ETS82212.1 hypothetical protein PFICI_07214 [Pestalotiopsis fici W106-1]
MSFAGSGNNANLDNDGGDGSGSAFDVGTSPFAWILVPICILVVAAIIITVFRYRRRNKQRNSHGMVALQRDLEALGPNRVRRSTNTRWQWAGDGPRNGRRVGIGIGSREEGLNELGEAPPAYSPPQKNPNDDVELHDYVASPTVHEPSATPPSQVLPAYGEAQHGHNVPNPPGNTLDGASPSAPAPAVLPVR